MDNGLTVAVFRRLAAIRWRLDSRPAGDRRQQREQSGAVVALRTWRPQVVHVGSGGRTPMRRRRRRRMAAAAGVRSVMCR